MVVVTKKIKDKDGNVTAEETVTLDRDEGMRPGTTFESISGLKPVYEGGTVTAGNASQLSDGAGRSAKLDADGGIQGFCRCRL